MVIKHKGSKRNLARKHVLLCVVLKGLALFCECLSKHCSLPVHLENKLLKGKNILIRSCSLMMTEKNGSLQTSHPQLSGKIRKYHIPPVYSNKMEDKKNKIKFASKHGIHSDNHYNIANFKCLFRLSQKDQKPPPPFSPCQKKSETA